MIENIFCLFQCFPRCIFGGIWELDFLLKFVELLIHVIREREREWEREREREREKERERLVLTAFLNLRFLFLPLLSPYLSCTAFFTNCLPSSS